MEAWVSHRRRLPRTHRSSLAQAEPPAQVVPEKYIPQRAETQLCDGVVMQIQQIPILIPLAVGAAATFCTIFIHAMPLAGTVWFVRREKSLGHTGRGFWIDMRIVALVILLAMAAHLIEIAVWAAVFLQCDEFGDIGTAFYHSAVNFTSLGYGDVLLSPHWRMLGPLEAADGLLMFGVSTAMIFAVILGLTQARFADLRD